MTPTTPLHRSRKADAGHFTERQHQRILLVLARDQLKLREPFAQALARDFTALGRQVGLAYREVADDGKARGDEPKPPADVTLTDVEVSAVRSLAGRVMAQVQRRLGGTVTDWWSAKGDERYRAQYRAVIRTTAGTLEATIGPIAFQGIDEVERRVIDEGGRRVGLVYLEDQTRDALFRALAEARARGLNPVQTERLVRPLVSANGRGDVSARAMRIARTETAHAQRMSSLNLYRASGRFADVTLYDNRTGYDDADCIARNGRVVSFADAEAEMAAEHPNGTLDIAPGSIAP